MRVRPGLQRLDDRRVVRHRARSLHPADASSRSGTRRLAAVEMERCAAKGAHAFAFSENPEPLGLPTIHDPDGYWDPVLPAAQRPRDGRVHARGLVVDACRRSRTTRRLSPTSRWAPVRTAGTMLAWLFSDYFDRMPDLKIALSEGNIGWIPYFLERAEQVIDKQRHWVDARRRASPRTTADGASRSRRPRHTSTSAPASATTSSAASSTTCTASRNLDIIGEDNVMIETDYPHTDTTWPDCIDLAKKRLAHLPPEVQYKILRGNAERLFRFEAAQPPTASLTVTLPGCSFTWVSRPTTSPRRRVRHRRRDRRVSRPRRRPASRACSSPSTRTPRTSGCAGGGHHALDPFVALSFAAAATTHRARADEPLRRPVPEPVPHREGGAEPRRAVGRAAHPRCRRGLPRSPSSRAGRRLRRAQRAHRRGDRRDAARVDRGRGRDDRAGTSRRAATRCCPHPRSRRARRSGWAATRSARIRRAVDLADGWTPMPNPRELGNRRRSAYLENIDDLKAMLAYADGYRAETGATGRFDVSRDANRAASPAFPGYDTARLIDHIARARARWASWISRCTRPPTRRGSDRPHR